MKKGVWSSLRNIAVEMVTPQRTEEDNDPAAQQQHHATTRSTATPPGAHERVPTPTNSVAGSGVDSGAPKPLTAHPSANSEDIIRRLRTEVSTLHQEIQSLRAENEDIKRRTHQYGIEVAKNHEATEKYYKQMIAKAGADHTKAMDELKGRLTETDRQLKLQADTNSEQLANVLQEVNQRVIQLSKDRDSALSTVAELEAAWLLRKERGAEAALASGSSATATSSPEPLRIGPLMDFVAEVQRMEQNAVLDTCLQLASFARSVRDSQKIHSPPFRPWPNDNSGQDELSGAALSHPEGASASPNPDPQLTRELEAVRAMVHERDAEIERLLRQADDRLERSHQEKGTLSETMIAVQEENASVKAQLTSLEGKVRELEAAASTSRLTAEEGSTKVLSELQVSHSTLERQCQTLGTENQQLKKDLQDSMLKLAAANAQLQDSRKALESAKNIQSHSDSTTQTLQGTVKDLQTELHRLRDISAESTRILMEGSQKAANSTGIKDLQVAASMPHVNSVSLAAAISGQLSTLSREFLERDQTCRQWEATYEQAKAVNTSTQGQLQASWKEVAHLKEECSRRDATLASIRHQLASEGNQLEDRDRIIAQKEKEMTRLAETVRTLETQLTQVQCQATMEAKGQANADEIISNLRYELLEREKEIVEANRAVANLQSVLDQFKAQRQNDIAEQTDYLNHEIETMRTQLAAEVAQRAQRNEAIEQLKVQHQKDIAQKNVTLQGLQTRLKELRKVLEETATKLNDDHNIDKRVVSHLLVNYIHSTVEQRPDTDDQVRVMSGLLNWDATMMEKAGLIQGPLNPKPPTGALKSAWTSLWGRGNQSAAPSSSGQGQGSSAASSGKPTSTTADGKKAGAGSLAEMWVDFLMKESANLPSGSDPAHDETSAGGPTEGN